MRNKLRRLIDPLTKREVEKIREDANFSVDQAKIFDLLCQDTLYDDGIMQLLNMPERRYYDNKRAVIEKVQRLVREI